MVTVRLKQSNQGFLIALFPLFSIAPYMFFLIFFMIDKTDEFQMLFFIVQDACLHS